MKKLLLSVFICISFFSSVGQVGNEWIDFGADQRYVKFKIGKTGLYRIDKVTLEFALQSLSPSVNLNSIDPRTIQVFTKGVEQPIFIAGQSDGAFDSGDYIELLCEANDGWLDERLYPTAAHQTNPHYSLYSDTSTYFLTWLTDGSFSSERYIDIPYGGAAVSPMPYFWYEQIKSPNSNYHGVRNIGAGVTNTLYHGGKGWISNEFGYNGNTNRTLPNQIFNTPNALLSASAPNARLETALVGINNGAGGVNAHHVRLRYKSGITKVEFDDVLFGSYDYVRHNGSLDAQLFTNDDFTLDAYTSVVGASNETSSDYSALAYMKLQYAHDMKVTGENLSELNMIGPSSSTALHVNLLYWGSETTSYLYDKSLKRRYAISQPGSTLKTKVIAGPERSLYIQKDNTITSLSANNIEPVGTTGRFIDYSTIEKDSAFIIITNRDLSTSAAQYAAYRNSTHNGRTVVVYVDDLYDQFAYGIQLHPQAIRGFCKQAIDTWNSPPQYLLLLGKAIEESTHRKSAVNRSQVLVPTMGSPPSDNLLTMGLGTHPYAPTIATGRLAVTNNTSVTQYLNKLREAELAQNDIASEYTINKRLWQKHVLQFAGGSDSKENQDFRSYLKNYESLLEEPRFVVRSSCFQKLLVLS